MQQALPCRIKVTFPFLLKGDEENLFPPSRH